MRCNVVAWSLARRRSPANISSFLSFLWDKGWGMRNRGTFIPCLAALVVRRAGPEGRAWGTLLIAVRSFQHESLPTTGLLRPGCRVGSGTPPERDVREEVLAARRWSLIRVEVGAVLLTWVDLELGPETERVPLCGDVQCNEPSEHGEA